MKHTQNQLRQFVRETLEEMRRKNRPRRRRTATELEGNLDAAWSPSPLAEPRGNNIRETDSAGPGVNTDPTTSKVPYEDYKIQRGVDIHSYWYASPGDKATGGDPGRPDDPAAYIGMKAPSGEAPEGKPATESQETRNLPTLEEDDPQNEWGGAHHRPT